MANTGLRPDYARDFDKFREFLTTFEDEFTEPGRSKYMHQLQAIANKETPVFRLELDDLASFDQPLCRLFQTNAHRYISILSDAIDEAMPPSSIDNLESDIFDILLEHRRLLINENNNEQGENMNVSPEKALPKDLLRRYEVQIESESGKKLLQMRALHANLVGSFVQLSGIVTRISDVRPLVKVVTYTCDNCSHELYQPVDAKEFTPLQQCQSESCRLNRNSGKLVLQTRGSKFLRSQEIKLQELPEQVPVGSVPRSITAHVFGELTRLVTSGNEITVSGIFLPSRYSGWKQMKAGLIADTFIQAMDIRKEKKTFQEVSDTLDEREKVQVMEQADDTILSRLSRSIAPEIFGLEDVKMALLLVLAGGVTNVLKKSGMKIRGDINVLMMGDPGVAKSQLLKQVATIAPRGVYTTGKGSSGVGLTAAVIRDPTTNEMVLEGGALVIADQGICCIDEFDKMDESDRTAIHEVMEQQTVSIAKAGITTTLNARTCIVAAANPLYGRYDDKLTPEENINLPTALMSRFDLIFLLRDTPDSDNDMRLAKHILHVHQTGSHPRLDFEPFSNEFLRKYISIAREYRPTIPKELTQLVCEAYVAMRQNGQDSSKEDLPCTPRMLLSVLRIAQASARLHFRDSVAEEDIYRALK